MSRFKLLGLSLFLAMSLTACKESLYTNLSEKDANEILVSLLKRGVDAEKVATGKTGFSVMVEQEDIVRALEITKENSLPRETFATLGTVFSGQGMIASQTEEQARLAFAISQELSASFSKIEGVLSARVHVVLVQHEQSSGVTTPPSAAVFIRHNENSPVPSMLAAIKETTAKAVPGLALDNVSVMTELAKESVLAPKIKVKQWYEAPASIVALSLAPLLLLLGIAGGVMYFLGFKIKREKKTTNTMVSSTEQNTPEP